MKVKEYNYNHYLCPSKLMPYVNAILMYSWYDCIIFENSKDSKYIGMLEFNSNVPEDVYLEVFEKAKKDYIEATGDTTLDNFENKNDEIEKYARYSMNAAQDKYPAYTYSCAISLMPYVCNILNRCWYTCNTKLYDKSYNNLDNTAMHSNTITFESTAPEDVIQFVIERARMEYISSKHDEAIYVSAKEEKRWMWLTFMREYYWKTNLYFVPTESDYEMLKEFESNC